MLLAKVFILFVLFFSISVYGQPIKDISTSSSLYPAVKKSVDKGYLSLFQDNQFQGNRRVTRKEMALIIDKILTELEAKKLNLTTAEIQEILHLSKSFKGNTIDQKSRLKSISNTINLLLEDQKIVQYDLTEINDQLTKELTQIKKENADWRLYFMIGVTVSTVLGLLI